VFVYAMIGIPIMLVVVAMIGDVMADVFRFVYVQLCCCGLCARRARRRRRRRDAAERHRRETEVRELATSGGGGQTSWPPPSWTQLYHDEMSLTRNQHTPAVVDDYDDLLDEEVVRCN